MEELGHLNVWEESNSYSVPPPDLLARSFPGLLRPLQLQSEQARRGGEEQRRSLIWRSSETRGVTKKPLERSYLLEVVTKQCLVKCLEVF